MSGIIGVSPNMKTGVVGAPIKGTWVLLQEKEELSSASEIDLGNGTVGGHIAGGGNPFSSRYRDYKIIGSEVAISAGGSIHLRWSQGGLITSGYKTISSGRDASNAVRTTDSTGYAYAFITGGGTVQAQTTGQYGGINFTMYLNHARSAGRTVVYGHSAYRQDNFSGHIQYTSFAANNEGSAGAIDYVRIYSSTTIRTAKISLYGLAL